MNNWFRGKPGDKVIFVSSCVPELYDKTMTLISVNGTRCILLLDNSGYFGSTMKQFNAARIKKKDFPYPYSRWKNAAFGRRLLLANIEDIVPVLFNVGDFIYSPAYGIGTAISNKDECLQVSFFTAGKFIKDYKYDGLPICQETFKGDERIYKPKVNWIGNSETENMIEKSLQRLTQIEKLVKRMREKAHSNLDLNGKTQHKDRILLSTISKQLDDIYKLARMGNE